MFRSSARSLSFVLGALTGAAVGLLAGRRWQAAPPALASVGGAFDQVNEGFHEHYGEARDDKSEEVPVFLVIADSLIVRRGDERHEDSFSPRLFHLIKSVAHGPVALYALLHRHAGSPLDDALRSRLSSLGASVTDARRALDDETAGRAVVDNLAAILDRSLAHIDRVLASGRVDPVALDAFAGDLGPRLLRSTDDATRVQLDALNGHVLRALERLDERDRQRLQVIVTGDHQARSRSLAMQYFTRLLGEREGEERRVAYAEGITDEEEALALVGTRRLDHAIATAFFGNARRLQRDVLADAAEAQLRDFAMPELHLPPPSATTGREPGAS